MKKLHPTKYNGIYVTDDGEVWTEWYRAKPHRRPDEPRKLNQYDRGGVTDGDRYRAVSLCIKDAFGHTIKNKLEYVHRLVAETLVPNPNNQPEIDHDDDNKRNNCASNLIWTDRKGNQRKWMLGNYKLQHLPNHSRNNKPSAITINAFI